MNKKYIIIGIIVIAVVAAALFFYREKPQDILSVASNDGTAKLEIPKDALPSGVKVEDISVTRMAEPLLKGAYAGYHLKPNGVQFRKSISITFELPFINNGNVPLLMIADESGLEMVAETEVVFSQALNRVTVSGKLAHFSDIYIIGMGHQELDIDQGWLEFGFFSMDLILPPPTMPIPVGGDAFDAEGYFVIENPEVTLEHDFEVLEMENDTERFVISNVHINGTWRNTYEELAPHFIADSPDEDVIEELEYIESFQCVFPGIARLSNELYIEFNLYSERKGTINGEPYFDSGDQDVSVQIFKVGEVSCVEEEKKDQGVIGQPEDEGVIGQPEEEEPPVDADATPEPSSAPPAPSDSNEARCLEVCGSDRYSPETSLNECSDTSEAFLCIQNKQACYNYLIPRGWQTDSNCCCKDEPIVTYAGDRIECYNFKGWGINGYAVDRNPYYPFGESTKSAAECK